MTTEDLSFSRDERWTGLSPESQQGMINKAFDQQVASDSRFADLAPEKQQVMRDTYARNAHANALGDYKADETDGVGNVALNTAVDLAKGVVGSGEAVVGILDLATYNAVGDSLAALGYDPELTKQFLDAGYSDQRAVANQAVASADGFMPTIKALIEHPSVAFGSIIESAPLSLGSAAVAKTVASRLLAGHLVKAGITAGTAEGIAAASKFFADPKIRKVITLSGAAAEGAATAGSIQEQGRQAGKSWEETAIQAASAGVATAAIGVISSKVPGFKDSDAETLLATAGKAGKKQSLLDSGKTIAKGIFKEGALEELPQSAQEQVFTNLALDRPWNEGVGSAAAQGLVVGAAQGGGLITGAEVLNQAGQAAEKISKPKSPRVAADFKGKVESAVEASDIGGAGTIDHDDYNPTVAIDALAEINKNPETSPEQRISNIEKAIEIQETLVDTNFKESQVIQELYNRYQKDKKDLSTEELKTLRTGIKKAKTDAVISTDLDSVIASMDRIETTPQDLKTNLAEATENEPAKVKEAITKIMGSKSGGGDIANYLDFDAIAADPNIDAETKSLVKGIQDLQNNRKELDKFNAPIDDLVKSTADVSSDIFQGSQGGRRFRGINSYQQAISAAMETGNTATAKNELNKLTAWATKHKTKLAKFRADSTTAPNLLKNIELEVEALDNAVKVANSIFEVETGVPSLSSDVLPDDAPSVVSPAAGHGPKATEGVDSLSPEETTKPDTKAADDTRQAEAQADKPVEGVSEAKDIKEASKVGESANSLVNNTPEFTTTNKHYASETTSKLKKNLIHHLPSFFKQIVESIKTGTFTEVFTLNQDTKPDESAISLVKTLSNFNSIFTGKFNILFDFKLPDNQFGKDPLHDLMVDGKLPDNVLAAMSIVSFNWLVTRGQDTVSNEPEEMASLLGLPRDTHIPDLAKRLIGHIGVSSNALGDTLGAEAFKLLGIKNEGGQEFDYQERLEEALGAQMLATMQKMELLERTVVRTSGIDQLVAHLQTGSAVDKNNFYIIGAPKKGDLKVDYFKIKPNSKTLDSYKSDADASPDTISLMIQGERDPERYQWSKPTDVSASMKRTSQNVTKQEQANLLRSTQRAWQANKPAMNMFAFLGELGQQTVSGFVDTNAKHDINNDSNDGINLGIQNNINNVFSFLNDAVDQAQGYATEFFIGAEFWKNGRMGMLGPINPQGNKIHRFLFGMKDWETTIDPNNSTHEIAFFKALGQAFGIESGKVGGMDNVIDIMQNKKLNTPVMEDAIAAAIDFLELTDGKDIDPEAMRELGTKHPKIVADLLAGVVEGGENVHTMKGIVEYARFLTAKADSDTFISDLPNEIDGMTNGMILGAIQLITEDTPKEQVLGLLNNGGFIYTNEFESMDTHLGDSKNYDAYEKTGSKLLKNISVLYDKVDTESKEKIKAVMALLNPKGKGLASEDGLVSSVMRKLSKQPTMTTVYGVGEKTLTRNLISETIIEDGFYGQLEQIAANGDVSGLRTLYETLRTITGVANPFDGSKAVVDGVMNSQEVLKITLNPAVQQSLENPKGFVAKNFGNALIEAVDEQFGSFKAARTVLNDTVKITTALYNTLFKLHLKRRQSAIGPDKALTANDYTEITELLQDMLPTIATPAGGKLEVAKKSRKRDHTERNKKKRSIVHQEYKNKGESLKVMPLRNSPLIKGILVDPGVAAVILGIHNVDSRIANEMIGSLAVLNNHDGFTGNILEGVDAAEMANQTTQDTLRNYHMAGAFNKSIIDSHTAFLAHLTEHGFSVSERNTMMKEVFKELNITEFFGKEQHKGNPNTAINTIKAQSKSLAEQTIPNKLAVLNSTTHIAQYPDEGYGIDTGNKEQKEILGVDVKTLNDKMQAEVEADAAIIAEAGISGSETTKLGSNINSQSISTDAADYSDPQEVSSKNVVDVYDDIKNDSNVPLDPTWDAKLKSILTDTVSIVMDPVAVYLKKSIDNETQGLIDFGVTEATQNKIYISSQVSGANPQSGMLANGLRMSTGEVYVHELVHGIVESGLRLNDKLRGEVRYAFNLVKQHIAKMPVGERYKVFLNDPTINVADKANRFEVAAAKARYKYVFENEGTRNVDEFNTSIEQTKTRKFNNDLDEFMAFGLTNSNFNKLLQTIKVPKRANVKSHNIQSFILEIYNRVMNFIKESFQKTSKEPNVALELERLARNLSAKDSANKTKLMNTVVKLEGTYSKVMTVANNKLKATVKSTPVLRIANDLKIIKDSAKDKDSLLGESIRKLIESRNNFTYGFIQQIADEIKGGTDKLERLYHLLNMRGVILDQHREDVTRSHKAVLTEMYGRELTTEEKTTVTKIGLRTDLSTLLNNHTIDEIQAMVSDPKILNDRITELNEQIKNDPDLTAFEHYYRKASKAMGYFMVHGRALSDVNGSADPFMNASVIAELTGTDNHGKLNEAQVSKAEKIVDELGSLYALEATSINQRNKFDALISENSEAVTGTLNMHNELKQQAKDALFNGHSAKFIKGYTKQILNPNKEFRSGTLNEEAELAKQGYVRSDEPIKRDKYDFDTTVNYMYTRRTGRANSYFSTLVSFTGLRAKGTNPFHISKDPAVAQANNAAIIKRKRKARAQMFKDTPLVYDDTTNPMIAQLDDKGNITKYRYMMAESTKDGLMEQHNAFDDILGSMAGQIVDKQATTVINDKTINALKDFYDEDYDANPRSYVEIGPYAKEQRNRDIYFMLPDKTKQTLNTVWGGNTMRVKKDVVNLVFGYPRYSIVEAFNKDAADRVLMERVVVDTIKLILAPFGKEAQAVLVAKNIEDVMIELTKLAKNSIIVRTVTVTMGNYFSNNMYLRSRGVSMRDIFKYSNEAIKGVIKYQKDNDMLDALKIRLKVAPARNQASIKAKIRELDNEIALNPTTMLIESGMLPTIVDDVETGGSSNPFPSPIDKAITKAVDKLPEPVQNVGRAVFMTEDTQGYKTANNAVKMTDFVSRYVLYHHYMNGKDGGKEYTHDQAMSSVIDEFINFSLPTHRTVEYLNQVGLVWFSKYQLRILRVIYNMVKDKPAETLTAFMFSSALGASNILMSIPGVTKDTMQMFGNPLESLIDVSDELITTSVISDVIGLD